jgi:hypothetical protein
VSPSVSLTRTQFWVVCSHLSNRAPGIYWECIVLFVSRAKHTVRTTFRDTCLASDNAGWFFYLNATHGVLRRPGGALVPSPVRRFIGPSVI